MKVPKAVKASHGGIVNTGEKPYGPRMSIRNGDTNMYHGRGFRAGRSLRSEWPGDVTDL